MDIYATTTLACEIVHSLYKGIPLESATKKKIGFLIGTAGTIAAIKHTLPKLTQETNVLSQQTKFLAEHGCCTYKFAHGLEKLVKLERLAIVELDFEAVVQADLYSDRLFKTYVKSLAKARKRVRTTQASFHVEQVKKFCGEVKFNVHSRFRT